MRKERKKLGALLPEATRVNLFVISCFPKNKMICLHCLKKKKKKSSVGCKAAHYAGRESWFELLVIQSFHRRSLYLKCR